MAKLLKTSTRLQKKDVTKYPSSLHCYLLKLKKRRLTLAILTTLATILAWTTIWSPVSPLSLSPTPKISAEGQSKPIHGMSSLAFEKKIAFMSRKIGQAHQVYMEARALDSHTWEIIPHIEYFSVYDGNTNLKLFLPKGYEIIRGQNPITVEGRSESTSHSWIVSAPLTSQIKHKNTNWNNQAAHVVLQARDAKGSISSWSLNLKDERTWSPQNTFYTTPKDRSPAQQPPDTGLSLKAFFSNLSFKDTSNLADEDEHTESPQQFKSQRFRPQSLGISQ